MTNLEMILTAIVAVESILLIGQTIGIVEKKSALQKGLDKAELDRCDMVRIPVNDVLDCGMSGNLGLYSGRIPTQKELASDSVGHPATLTRDKRSKL